MYHSVSDDPEYRDRVSVKAFSDQMEFLSHYFDVIVFNEEFVRNIEVERYDSGSKPKVLLTFDDGFKDNITNVLPISLTSEHFGPIFRFPKRQCSLTKA